MEGVKAPRFIQPLTPKTVCEGEVAIMEVVVESYPTCSFQWFQHNVAVKVSIIYLKLFVFLYSSWAELMRGGIAPHNIAWWRGEYK